MQKYIIKLLENSSFFDTIMNFDENIDETIELTADKNWERK
jgi:hypothetical protein